MTSSYRLNEGCVRIKYIYTTYAHFSAAASHLICLTFFYIAHSKKQSNQLCTCYYVGSFGCIFHSKILLVGLLIYPVFHNYRIICDAKDTSFWASMKERLKCNIYNCTGLFCNGITLSDMHYI